MSRKFASVQEALKDVVAKWQRLISVLNLPNPNPETEGSGKEQLVSTTRFSTSWLDEICVIMNKIYIFVLKFDILIFYHPILCYTTL